MKTSRTTLQFETGCLIHPALATVFAALCAGHVVAWVAWAGEMLFLRIRLRRLFWPALLLSGIVWGSMLWWESRFDPPAKTTYEGWVVEVGTEDYVLRTEQGKFLVRPGTTEMPMAGDEVEIRGDRGATTFSRIPHTFDYRKFLSAEGIVGVLYAKEVHILGHRFTLNQIRTAVRDYLQSTFPGEEGGLMTYVLLGDNDLLSAATTEAVNDLGISHLFAISGMNVAMMAAFLERLLKTLYLRREWRQGIVLGMLGIYTVIAGCPISLVRAALMVGCVYLKEGGKWPFTRLDTLSMILIGCLILRPASLGTLGFQLSFLVTFAILLGKNLLKTEGELRGILKIGLYANLVALPLLLAVNHRFNPLSIPANLFFVMFVERLLFPLTFLTAFVPGFFPLFRWVSALFQAGVCRLAVIDVAVHFNFVSDFGKVLYFLGIGGLLKAAEQKRDMRKILIALILLLMTEWFAGTLPGVTYVRVLDVGQGDAIHIRNGAVNVLIDTGKPDSYDALIGYFHGENIRKIDAVFLTHDHEDHTGEIQDLAREFPIGVIFTGYDLPSLSGLPHSMVVTGEEVHVGGLTFSVLSSCPEALDENDRSLVLSVRIGCH
ncbi:MAG TPA: ComEC/Rec2 family competence protein, partial [Candidatus Izemoplasmatales bacterium]|nr:ComEC/Rec2 family competence protein [Candidatus Izemoplasmatales bacterium]